MKIVEISGYLENGMWGFGPPFPDVSIERATGVDDHGVDTHKIILSTVSGTYLETTAHLFPGDPTLDQIPVTEFIRDVAIIKLPKAKEAGEQILLEELESANVEVRPKDSLLIYTGWDRNWNNDNFVIDSPYFSKDGMDWVIQKRISLLGADLPCYDNPRDPNWLELPRLRKLYEALHPLLLTPVVNLGMVKSIRAKLIVLPLAVRGVSSAPCRALILENGEL